MFLCIFVQRSDDSPSVPLDKLTPTWAAKYHAQDIKALRLEFLTALQDRRLLAIFKAYERNLTESMPGFLGWSHYDPNPALKDLAWAPLYPSSSPYTVHIAALI